MHVLAVKYHVKNLEKTIFHTNKCSYMSLDVRMVLPICEENGHVFPYSVSKSDQLWNCLSNMGVQTLVLRRIFLSLYPFNLNQDKDYKSAV